jgi:hemolysin III
MAPEAKKATAEVMAPLVLTDDTASAAIHLGGLALAAFLTWRLRRQAATPMARRSAAILGPVWGLLYVASIAYHLAERGTLAKSIALVFDDGAIFVAIAGTYTPVMRMLLPQSAQRVMLRALWVIAGAGLSAAALAVAWQYLSWYQPSVLGSTLICGFGPAVAYARTLTRGLPPRARLQIALSGLVYVGGACFYRARDLPWHHSYWHAAVVLGSVLDFMAIAALTAGGAPPTQPDRTLPARNQPVRTG